MTNVMILCPVTERSVPVGLQVHPSRRFRSELPQSGSVRCLACHRRHYWDRQETILEGTTASWRRDGRLEPKLPAPRHLHGRDLAQP